MWPLRPQRISRTPYYIRNRHARSVRSATKRLASLFEGAKQRKSTTILTPIDRIEKNAPQRVHITVSPPKVVGTDADQISLQPNISSHSTPNSHSRQKTPARRIVKPQTPHGMVQHSARQKHNLSQDMIAETVSQANQCFSISAQPKTQELLIPQVIQAHK
jgi:hypothetical protein